MQKLSKVESWGLGLSNPQIFQNSSPPKPLDMSTGEAIETYPLLRGEGPGFL